MPMSNARRSFPAIRVLVALYWCCFIIYAIVVAGLNTSGYIRNPKSYAEFYLFFGPLDYMTYVLPFYGLGVLLEIAKHGVWLLSFARSGDSVS